LGRLDAGVRVAGLHEAELPQPTGPALLEVPTGGAAVPTASDLGPQGERPAAVVGVAEVLAGLDVAVGVLGQTRERLGERCLHRLRGAHTVARIPQTVHPQIAKRAVFQIEQRPGGQGRRGLLLDEAVERFGFGFVAFERESRQWAPLAARIRNAAVGADTAGGALLLGARENRCDGRPGVRHIDESDVRRNRGQATGHPSEERDHNANLTPAPARLTSSFRSGVQPRA
jgi:hypothetical protein